MKLTKSMRDIFKALGKRGGKARAENLTKVRRIAIAKQAAAKRWDGHVKKSA